MSTWTEERLAPRAVPRLIRTWGEQARAGREQARRDLCAAATFGEFGPIVSIRDEELASVGVELVDRITGACPDEQLTGASMSKVTAESQRIHTEYRGHFAEPIFAVLGNPAKLYSNLLRHLGRFGATVGGLNINVSVLAQANVGCLLSSGFVRVTIDRLELFLRDTTSQREVEQVLTQAFAAMVDTDDSLKPMRHEAIIQAWARLKEEPFSTYIRRFVTTPDALVGSKASVEFVEMKEGRVIGAIRLEESAHTPEGLFLRSEANLGSIEPRATDIVSAYRARLTAQLNAVDLDLPFRVE